MFNVVLFEPEIPPNTGNIIRLCANMGCDLLANVSEHQSYQTMLDTLKPKRIFACSTKGCTNYDAPDFQAGDTFIFGPETRGLPDVVLAQYEVGNVLRIPMIESSRSINLANSVGIILYEAWRQQGFKT